MAVPCLLNFISFSRFLFVSCLIFTNAHLSSVTNVGDIESLIGLPQYSFKGDQPNVVFALC